MTLNDLERRNSPYFAFFFNEFDCLSGHYVTVVQDGRIMFVKYCLSITVPLLDISNPLCSAVSLR